MLTERLYDTGRVVLNIAEGSTKGPALLLLHGATLNWQSFSEFIPSLEHEWHLYALDFRGHGKSGWVPSAYQVVDYLQDVVEIIEQVIGQQVVVMGFSLGALVTLGIAERLPRVVRAIIPLDPGLMFRDASLTLKSAPGPYEWVKWLAETLQPAHSLEEVVNRCKEYNPALDEMGAQVMAEKVRQLDPTMIARLLSDQPHGDFAFEQILSRISCPTLIIRGDPALGGVVRDSDVMLLQTLVPQSRTIQIPNVGHGVIWGQAGAQTLEHVTRFLGTL